MLWWPALHNEEMKTLWGKIMNLRVCILAIYVIGLFDLPGASACSGRRVLNETSGEITDGSGDYPASAHCEWLIIGKDFNCT